jgi:hypothetical protein
MQGDVVVLLDAHWTRASLLRVELRTNIDRYGCDMRAPRTHLPGSFDKAIKCR